MLLENEEREYGILEAVSGANPVLAGVIALMLQADPTLDTEEIRTILQETARADGQTGNVPNPEWGFGKLDALAAVERALGISSTDNEQESIPVIKLFPNPVYDVLNISAPTTLDNMQFIIYDNLGRLIHAGTINRYNIPISQLHSGIYNLHIFDKGQLIGNESFLKL